ncbi:hypothetical protein AZS04_000981 [Escherichia coli]|nr:hypothetical protein [Escherichia coli]
MIVRPQQHWLRRIFVWHGSVLSKISSRLLLNFLFSIAVIFMLPWYTHLGIKFTLAPFSILGVAIAIFLGFRNNAGYARYVEARKLWGQLMIASRSLLREVKTTLPDSASVREFARLQIGGTGIHISDLKLAMGLNASKGKKTAIDKIYPQHFLATAKVLKFPEVQMHEILSDFARMIPAALDNVKNSLPTDFPENVVTAVETNVLRLHGRLSREYGIK